MESPTDPYVIPNSRRAIRIRCFTTLLLEYSMLRRIALLFVMLYVFVPFVFGQSEEGNIQMFGYFQASYENVFPRAGRKSQSSFSLQQLNLMVARDLSPSFNAFVNFEVTNSFSSDLNWGSFRLEEAWVRYYHNNLLSVKAGLLVPEFNGLNEIKNKTPLLPYIFRPFVYERSISDLADLNDFVPQQAYIQLYGTQTVGESEFEYAVYIGNSEEEYSNSTTGNLIVRGVDSVTWKTVGGRLGFDGEGIRLGTSLTFDKDKIQNSPVTDVPRTRLGVDLSVHVSDWTFDGELITVGHTLTNEQNNLLLATAMPAIGRTGTLGQLFYYGLLNYDFTEKIYAYISYDYLHDRASNSLAQGVHMYTVGGGFRPATSVVIKAQFYRLQILDSPLFRIDEDHALVAVSVSF